MFHLNVRHDIDDILSLHDVTDVSVRMLRFTRRDKHTLQERQMIVM